MSIKDNFSAEEWYTVLTGPARAGGAVVAASPSGITGLIAEAQAMMQATLAGLSAQTPLLEAMSADITKLPRVPDSPAEPPRTLPEAQKQALQAVRQAIWLVATKATPADLAAYKVLIMQVAHATAQAAKEGGLFGLGGEVVNGKERTVLEQLAGLTADG